MNLGWSVLVCCSQWGTLTKEEKGVYFTEAEKLRIIHQRQYPGWNNKINYVSTSRSHEVSSILLNMYIFKRASLSPEWFNYMIVWFKLNAFVFVQGKRRKRDRSPKIIRKPPPVPPTETFVRTKAEAQPKLIFGNCHQMGPMQPCYTAAAYMQNYQPQEAYVPHPQQGYMRCPQQAPYMQFPQQGGYMPFPQQGGYMQFPAQGGNMQFPQQGGYMQFPPQGFMQFPHLG